MTAQTDDVSQPKVAKPHYAGALKRFRVMAFATGIALATATFVAIPLKVWAGAKTFSFFMWMGHGYLFLIYAAVTLDLAVRMRWNPVRWVLVTLAGTVPLMSFVAEHIVVRDVRRDEQTRSA